MDVGFVHAFVASLSVIIVSELGDKTFFIAAIMAMRHSRITVFFGAIIALAVMTILSGLFLYVSKSYFLKILCTVQFNSCVLTPSPGFAIRPNILGASTRHL